MTNAPLPAPPSAPPPDEWAARKLQFDDLIKSFSAVLGVVTALLAILTAVGFVIVHLYLAQFTRIHGYNLNTSQYIAASVGMVVFFVILAAPVFLIYYALTSVARKTVQRIFLIVAGVLTVVVILALVVPLIQTLRQTVQQSNDPVNTLLALVLGIAVPFLPSFLNSKFYKERVAGWTGASSTNLYGGVSRSGPLKPFSGGTSASAAKAPAQPQAPVELDPAVFKNFSSLGDLYAKDQLTGTPPVQASAPPDNLAAPSVIHTVPEKPTPVPPDSLVRPSRLLTIAIVLALLAATIYFYGVVIYKTIPHYLGGGGQTPISVIFKPDADLPRFGLTPSADPRGYAEHLLLLAELTDGILVYDAQTAHAIAIRSDSILGFIDDTPFGTAAP